MVDFAGFHCLLSEQCRHDSGGTRVESMAAIKEVSKGPKVDGFCLGATISCPFERKINVKRG